MEFKFPDSLEESRSETDLLKEELKQKNKQLEEKNKIVISLRQQVDELENEAHELESNEQLMRQKLDRLKKESQEKDETIEAVSHAKNEIENAYELLNQKMEARMKQVQKLLEDTSAQKKELIKIKELCEESVAERNSLRLELDSMKRALRERERDKDEMECQNNNDLFAQMTNLKQQNSTLVAEVNKYKQHLKHQAEQHDNKRLLQEIEELKTVIREMKSSQRHSTSAESTKEPTNEEMVQELYDLRAKVKSLSHRLSRRSIDEEIVKLKQELEVTETSWQLERRHKERYARENFQLEKKINDLNKKYEQLESQLASMIAIAQAPNENTIPLTNNQTLNLHANRSPPPPPLPPKNFTRHGYQEHQAPNLQPPVKSEPTAAIHFSVADEMGEFMEKSSSILPGRENYCQNHRIKKSSFFQENNSLADEQKLRMERANELVRRNMQTKPLHQTSYPLELDTFDVPNLTETQIKRGHLPLADSSNQRKPVKKAEAFFI